MHKKQRIVCIITARSGSKGVPGKNIKLLNGKPLIAYAIEAAKGSKYLDRVIVSTDDQGIADVAKEWGAEVPVMRPARLAQDATPTLPVLLHMIDHLKKTENYSADIHVLIQPTSPFVSSEDVDQVIETLVKTKTDSCVTVCEVSERPERMYSIKGKMMKSYTQTGRSVPRQKLPAFYHLNGAVYATRVAVLPKGIIAKRSSAVIMPRERSLDIDTMMDFKLAEFFMNV